MITITATIEGHEITGHGESFMDALASLYCHWKGADRAAVIGLHDDGHMAANVGITPRICPEGGMPLEEVSAAMLSVAAEMGVARP